MTTFTQETILKTRQWFADNDAACIAEVNSGELKVTCPESYIAWCNKRTANVIAGLYDHTLHFHQRATFIQTGECVAILP